MVPIPLIRRAVPADIKDCLALGSREGAPPTGLAGDLADIERLLLVAEDAGRIIGYGRAMHFRRGVNPSDAVPTGYYLVDWWSMPPVAERVSGRS